MSKRGQYEARFVPTEPRVHVLGLALFVHPPNKSHYVPGFLFRSTIL